MTDRELMQMAFGALEKYWVSEGEVIKALRDRLAQPEPNYKAIFDLLFEANSADIEALTDAQFTLEAIKSADPGTYDEIITRSLNLIKVALNNSVVGPLEVIADKVGVKT
jgi:hypothetical protein